MAENLHVAEGSKAERYESLIPQIKALTDGETNLIANLANISAALKQAFGFFWVGFYLSQDNMLVLGPFQGTVACTRIPYNKGVCGACYTRRETIVVPDVEQFPGHIACSSASRSEIVLPAFDDDGNIPLVLDIDSDQLDDFDDTDAKYLQILMRHIEELLWKHKQSIT
jgi:L-methionine (R)-S-oxide reductase